MRFTTLSSILAGAGFVAATPVLERLDENTIISRDVKVIYKNCDVITPKVFIISMFSPEADIWYSNANTNGSIGNLLAKNITIPGFSPLFPQAHCLEDGSVCQMTTGESEINAATSVNSLMLSPLFNLKDTYFMIAGIAGINPKYGSIADVAFSKYAVQVALQYEFDAREIPNNYSTGYIPLGSDTPDEYPSSIYGTEVFEVNEALRDMAVAFAQTASLNDSAAAIAYRPNYISTSDSLYLAATTGPKILKCDVATSDVYFSGTLLGEAFENTTTLFTNGSGIYCMTAQEDNATLEAMIRAAVAGTIDFARIIIMRTGSDFDRPYPGISDEFNLFYSDQGAFTPAIANIYLAGTPVVKGILSNWQKTFKVGVAPTNYIGDIFGTLGGTPDFGPGPVPTFDEATAVAMGEPAPVKSRRDAYKKSSMSRRTAKGALGAETARRVQSL